MARLASNSQQPYSRGYEPSYETVYTTVELTFSEAVARVVRGDMAPLALFNQLPNDLQTALEDFSRATHEGKHPSSGNNGSVVTAQTFVHLPREKQTSVLKAFLEALNAPSKPPTAMTFTQAVEHVLRDEMNPEDLVDQLPGELQAATQHFSQALLNMENASLSGTPVVAGKPPFAMLTIERQKFVLQSLLQAMTKPPAENSQQG